MEELDQLFILDSLPVDKIKTSRKALAELESMNMRSINNNPIPWKQKNLAAIRLASLNCMNLLKNYDDIQHHNNLSESTVLVLTETWLNNTELNIDGYSARFNSAGNGKGIAVYIKNATFKPSMDVKQDKMQLTKVESMDMDPCIGQSKENLLSF